jgi:hypothetical protein
MPSDGSRHPSEKLVLALATLALVALAWRGVALLSLYGWDTFPLIAAGRIGSFRELLETSTEPLMDGRFPSGDYYRPLVHLSFALDWALSGLHPLGYHLTDLFWLALGALALGRLALALLGPGRVGWAFVAVLLYVLHPAQFEVVALPPRRGDSMALAFTLLALGATMRRARLSAALLSLAAAASKETGFLAPVLVLGLEAARSPAATGPGKLADGARASWISAALVAAFLVARTAVLGKLGGGARSALDVGVTGLSAALVRYAELVLAPLPPSFVAGGTALGLAAVAYLAATAARATPRAGDELAVPPKSAVTWLVVWLLLLLALTAVSGILRAWYALPFVAPVALLAALAGATMREPGGGKPVRTLVALALLAVVQGWFGDRVRRWSEIEASSDAAARFLAHFDEVVASSVPGSKVELEAFPRDASTTRHGEETRRQMIFREYSLRAYCELAHPGRDVRIEVRRAEPLEAAPGEVLVVLIPRED